MNFKTKKRPIGNVDATEYSIERSKAKFIAAASIVIGLCVGFSGTLQLRSDLAKAYGDPAFIASEEALENKITNLRREEVLGNDNFQKIWADRRREEGLAAAKLEEVRGKLTDARIEKIYRSLGKFVETARKDSDRIIPAGVLLSFGGILVCRLLRKEEE